VAASTLFTDPAAVDAWDAWFRWRDDVGLRDRTISSTWWRVADAIALAEGPRASAWSQRLVHAFSLWRLLPDERLLASAGTGAAPDRGGILHAVVNVAAFVIAPMTSHAKLDVHEFDDTTVLAMRLLDDARAAVMAGDETVELRIGLMGFADALAMLGIDYDSLDAMEQARGIAHALASGALRGSVELARERGGAPCDQERLAAVARSRHLSPALIADAQRWGVRHARLSRIQPHPRLSLLANNASVALDPAAHRPASLTAQVGIRAAMQPWIDDPIDYPLRATDAPDALDAERAARLASEHRLPSPRVGLPDTGPVELR
jgi:ribonucleoside-diphosphate reductase alpha chain